MIKYQKKFSEIFQKIQQANNILMICHKNPDSDCLGAMRGFGNYFDTIDKEYQMFNVDKIPEAFDYLRGVDKISNDLANIKKQNFDLILVLDTGSLDYSGVEDFVQQSKGKVLIINIDHHISNTNYGDINLVISNASSTSEIIYHLFKYNKVHIDKETANHLLEGIVADSGNFSNSATTIDSINAASHLLIRGGLLPKIIKNTYQKQSLNSLKLWGKILARLEKNEKYDIAYTYVTHRDLRESQLDEEVINGISNFLNKLAGSKAMMFVKEKKPGQISVSLRTGGNLIDLAKLAKMVGGGGHRKAAGFSVEGELKEYGQEVKVI